MIGMIQNFIRFLPVLMLGLACMPISSQAAPPPLPPVMDDLRQAEDLERDLQRSTGRIVILHFWASWCIPCRAEMAELTEFWRYDYPELAERGVRVVTISNDVRDSDLQRFAEHVDLAFPLYYDPYAKLTARYAVRGLPSSVILDRQGRVVRQLLGVQDWSSPDFHELLLEILEPGS
ncbi:MAG: TlpA family protein disulfide reductase [Wenzhouxiangellaceae bacterium]